jgi:hypothetical protein
MMMATNSPVIVDINIPSDVTVTVKITVALTYLKRPPTQEDPPYSNKLDFN